MCVWVCVFVVFVINLSCSFRTLFFLFSAFFLQCFLVVGLFVFPAICFIGHLFVCCSYKCSGICLSLVSETQHKRASFPPSAHYFLFELAVGGTRSLGALFEVVWLLRCSDLRCIGFSSPACRLKLKKLVQVGKKWN